MGKKSYLSIFLYLISCLITMASSDKIYDLGDGLSNSHVNQIYQDANGIIWICTDNGLNSFNGTEFKNYYRIQGDTNSLGDNSVLSILEDRTGNIWVGTTGGLYTFNRATQKFSAIKFSYPHITDFSYIRCIIEDSKGNIWLSTSLSGAICIKNGTPIYYLTTNSNICSDKINVIYEDRFGNIWIGSQDNGISVINTDNHTITNYAHQSDDPTTISSNKVFSFLEQPDGNMLIGTIDGGIDLFDYTTRKFIRNYIPSVKGVFTTYKDCKNNIWIGTDGHGLKEFNYKTKEISTYESSLININMYTTKVHSIFEDYQHNLWIALYQKGIMMIPHERRHFHNWGVNYFHPNQNIGTECVLSILEDSDKRIWIGTDGDGIYRLNAQREVERHFKEKDLPANVVLSIFEDNRKRIWIGTYLHGLFLYNPQKERFENIRLQIGNKEIKDIYFITADTDGTLWIGTNEDGLCLYNHDKKTIVNYRYNMLRKQNQILSNSIHTILFGKDSLVWIGTSSAGISCFDLRNHTFYDYNEGNGKLYNNNIFAIAQDKTGNIWVGTKWGLHYMDLQQDTTLLYTEADGLANASIAGIEIDSANNLWISTSLGLSHYDTQKGIFTNYYISDGLQNNEFRRGAHFQSADGELWFGGINGLSSFYPFSPETNHNIQNLMFTDLYLHNEKVEIKDTVGAILTRDINATERIKLPYTTRNFSIGFAALEYNSPDKVIYQVKMDHLDNDWRTLPSGSRIATYTNLKPGKYTFYVKAFLPQTEPLTRSLAIIITPPFWQTWWAKVLYLLFIFGIIYSIIYNIRTRIRQKHEALKKENDTVIMQSKLQFMTDISHEIRTPLTLILSPIETLLKETPDGPLRNTYKLIYQNGQRILHLVNQVMDMRKIDRGQMGLQATETQPVEFIHEITDSFNKIAEKKQITFTFHSQPGVPNVWIDHDKLDKIMVNILSNAFKYTPEHGKIDVEVGFNATHLIIKVSDSGEGIPVSERELVFNRFYQIQTENNRHKIGTGIGLHLCKSLIMIHHGNIYIENSALGGATFVIELPLSKDYLRENEIFETTTQEHIIDLPVDTDEPIINMANKPHTTMSYTLLLVEDDESLKEYLKSILSTEYRVLIASDGLSGLETAIKELPDCIISDVMMPGMDGIELCKKIKSNSQTCHIPVILLTAKASAEQRIEGLKVGADSYIPKPFSIEHLKTRIRKLIELRKTIQDKYEGKNNFEQETIKIKSIDEKLLEKLEKVVEEHISDPELSVDKISKEIGISRSQLQRRVKKLTNQNPSDYLKSMRLKYAASLLISKNLSISEVTYETGFSSLSHFSNSFKEFYGMSPSRYVEINRNASSAANNQPHQMDEE